MGTDDTRNAKAALASTDGKRWALWQRYDINDLNDANNLYLRRWRVIQTPWFGLYVHKIMRPDGDRYLHDHPWPFVAWVVKGGYMEHRWTGVHGWHWPFAEHLTLKPTFLVRTKWGREGAGGGSMPMGTEAHVWKRWSLHRVGLSEFHAIRKLLAVPTWTVVFVGRRHRRWGYMTEDGWVDQEEQHKRWVADGTMSTGRSDKAGS